MPVTGSRYGHAEPLFVVRGLGRHISKERSVSRGAGTDECLGLSPQYIGEIVAILAPEVPYGALVVHVVVVVAGLEVGEPAVPTRGYRSGVIVAVQVFPEESGLVTRCVETRRYVIVLVTLVLVRLPTSPRAVLIGPHPAIVRVLAPHYRGPAGTTQRVRDVGVREAQSPGFEDGARLRHVLQIVITHVVGYDKDDVGPGGGPPGLPRGTIPGPRHEQYGQGQRNRQDHDPSHVNHPSRQRGTKTRVGSTILSKASSAA